MVSDFWNIGLSFPIYNSPFTMRQWTHKILEVYETEKNGLWQQFCSWKSDRNWGKMTNHENFDMNSGEGLSQCSQDLTVDFSFTDFNAFQGCDWYYNKKAWEALNVYFSNKLRFEQKLYYCRPGLITRATKMKEKFLTQ